MRKINKILKSYYNSFCELIIELVTFEDSPEKEGSIYGKIANSLFAILTIFMLYALGVVLPIIGFILLILWVLTWVSLNVTNILAVIFIIGCGVFWIYEKSCPIKYVTEDSVLLWDDVANFFVCPVLTQHYGKRIEKELLYYLDVPLMGHGYYFALPITLSNEIECKTVERKIARKYAEHMNKEFGVIMQEQRLVVRSTFIFIRAE